MSITRVCQCKTPLRPPMFCQHCGGSVDMVFKKEIIEEVRQAVKDAIWKELSKRTYVCDCSDNEGLDDEDLISNHVRLEKDWTEFVEPILDQAIKTINGK